MKQCKLALIMIGIVVLGVSAFADNDRPLIFGQNPIGTAVWGNPAITDDMEFDKIAASGGASCRVGVNWDQIEPTRGCPRDWSSIDQSVKLCIDRGINPVILINSTPTWALPDDVNPDIPVPQARYAPRDDCLPDFDRFVYDLVRHYRGAAQYYEFWNEANGYGWHWDQGYHRADEYTPLMIRAYKQVKLADPTAKMSLTGMDDNGGDGDSFIEKVYQNGGKGYFDAVADHPYSRGYIEEWKLNDVRSMLDSHGDNNVDIWITEMGWTANGREDTVAGYITDYFNKLVANHPTVKIATYHTALDFPAENYGYGLLDKNLNEKPTYTAFKNYPKPTRPVVSGATITNLSPTSVRVDFNTDVPAKAVIMYGLTNAYGMISGRDTVLATTHSIILTGLLPSTTYHYRIRMGAVDYGDSYTSDATFTTVAGTGSIVQVLTGPTVTNITTSSATITWTTDVSSTATLKYGTDFNYGVTMTQGRTTSHSFQLQNLVSGTNYQFRISSSATGHVDVGVEGIPFTTVTSTKIEGHVRDMTGTALSGASVAASPGNYVVTSDADGHYAISDIPEGTYSLTASKQGYVDCQKTGIVTTVGSTTTVDFNLVSTTSTISNPGFEITPFIQYTDATHPVGDVDHAYPKFWTRFVLNNNGNPNFPKYSGFWGVSHSGTYSFDFYENNFEAGIFQQIGATSGTAYSASVWVAGFNNSGGTSGSMAPTFWIGIDPAGGTDATSSSVQWSDPSNPGGKWTKISKKATATGSGITIFLKTLVPNNPMGSAYYAAFDDVSLADSGTITGTIKNVINKVIPGASVVANPGDITVPTDTNGVYYISGLSDGTYSLTVTKLNYQTKTVSADVTTGSTTTKDIVLTDATPPSTPVVTDEGVRTFNLSEIYASWSATDLETGVSDYQYALRSESGVYLRDWTPVGSAQAVLIPMTLTDGTKYYFDVKAGNGDGLWSAVGSSDGVVARPAMTIADAKNLSDGDDAYITGIVTATFDEGGAQRFYVEDPNRTSGIGATTTTFVTPGDAVRVHGPMGSLNGERMITFAVPIIADDDVTIPTAVSMSNKTLGGGSMGHQAAPVNNVSTNLTATGLSNVGMLVNVWGKVTYVDAGASYFYINDGSDLTDGSGHRGVRVDCTGLFAPTVGSYATVKGVSAVTQIPEIGNKVIRFVRPRLASDLNYMVAP